VCPRDLPRLCADIPPPVTVILQLYIILSINHLSLLHIFYLTFIFGDVYIVLFHVFFFW